MPPNGASLPPGHPATSRQAAQLAQPDDEQIMRACQAYRAALAVRLRRWSGRCWLAGHTVDRSIEAYSWEVTMAMTILHRPVCVQCTSHCYGPWMSCLLAGNYCICSCNSSMHCTLHRDAGVQPSQPGTTRPRTQVFTPARPRPVKPARPAALRGGHLQG